MQVLSNDVELEHLGGGVCLFRNALSGDWIEIFKLCSNLVDAEHSFMYSPTIHPETGLPAYINKSGYLFTQESINSMPRRGSSVHSNRDAGCVELFGSIEEAKDYYLLKYFEKFPLAYNCVWWKVKGHLVSYSPGVYLGPHSDISAEYVYGVHQTTQELALRNVITSLVYLNSSVRDNLSDIDFSGGNHKFNYLDIEYSPNSGDILMFPSNYMAAHEVLPVTGGRRISYLGWYSQGTPNKVVGEDVCDPLVEPELATISTNIYMPTLRQQYRDFLISRGHHESSEHFSATKLVGE